MTIEKPDNFIEKYVVDYSSQIRTLRYPININKNNTINETFEGINIEINPSQDYFSINRI